MNSTPTPSDLTNSSESSVTRRDFVKTGAAAAAAFPFLGGAAAWAARTARAGGSDTVRLGLIGCGGRGTGAAWNAMEASSNARLVAMADVFQDRLDGSRSHLKQLGERGAVKDDQCYVGFDAYQQLIDHGEVDLVLLATPPHFRPIHFDAAIKGGKHVFMEKPVAVDPWGVRTVIAAGESADEQGLSVVTGTQRRHERSYLTAMEQLADGVIGEVTSARCYWNQGGLWMHPRQDAWTDMEWQLRNWLYFTWLSGDHIVEQHIHNLDVVNWAMGDHPESCLGMGGRQVRTDPAYGHIFDHFAIEYRYPGDRWAQSMCRQTEGCATRVEEILTGTRGEMRLRPGAAEATGAHSWRFEGENPNPYVEEHRHLFESLRGEGPRLNEAKQVAESTLTAIMGRMSAYTGQEVTWDQALHSDLELAPNAYAFGDLPTPEVAVPGKTPLV
ncbi:MAG: Gfo/Idh/MocA family protein [Phycisphaerales bacterium]